MQMKKLEGMVGDSLFERGSRGVALTRRGGELIANARRIVSLLDETAASMAAAPLGGPVRIGIPEEYGHAILSRALGAFSKRHTKVEVTVRYAHSGAQMAALAAGELDLGRLESYRKLQREQIFIESKRDAGVRQAQQRKWKQIAKANRKRTRAMGR